MKKEHILELMNAVPADLIEEADIQAPNQRRLPKAVRTGLIAACLCAALLGTAFAAQQFFFPVQVVERGDVYDFQGGATYYPGDSLSDELFTLVYGSSDELESLTKFSTRFSRTKGWIRMAFDSWQQAEDFIGLDLMNNPVLDASPTPDDWETNFDGVKGQFLIDTTPEMFYVDVTGLYQVDEASIEVKCRLITDRLASNHAEHGDVWDETFGGLGFMDGTQVEWDTYTAPSGLQAQIAAVDYPPENSVDAYIAVFSLNGVPTIVSAHPTGVPASDFEAYAALLQVLDGFVPSE